VIEVKDWYNVFNGVGYALMNKILNVQECDATKV